MPDNEEKRKAAVGVVTPNVDKDEDWRRQVAGVYSFGEETPVASDSSTNRVGLGLGLGI